VSDSLLFIRPTARTSNTAGEIPIQLRGGSGCPSTCPRSVSGRWLAPQSTYRGRNSGSFLVVTPRIQNNLDRRTREHVRTCFDPSWTRPLLELHLAAWSTSSKVMYTSTRSLYTKYSSTFLLLLLLLYFFMFVIFTRVGNTHLTQCEHVV
jgi:hypothetical protein